MKVKSEVFQKFQKYFSGKDLSFIMLQRENSEIERLAELLKKIDSEYLYPIEHEYKLNLYCEKLIYNAYNFMLKHKSNDIAVLSIYANNHETKEAFTSTIGILPSYRGGSTAFSLVKFGIKFSKEKGMEVYKAEVSKKNVKWLSFLKRCKFEIESETNNNSYIIVRNL